MKKLSVLAIIAVALMTSCGQNSGSGSRGANPYKAEYQITQEEARTLLTQWESELNKSSTFVFHGKFTMQKGGGKKEYFEANYRLEYSMYNANYGCYEHTYIPDSVELYPYNIKLDENAYRYVYGCYNTGKGIAFTLSDMENTSYTSQLYYHMGDTFGYYMTGSEGAGTKGIRYLTFNKQGILLNYYESFVGGGQDYVETMEGSYLQGN